MADNSGNKNTYEDSYLELRKVIGRVALALPFILAIGAPFLGHPGIQGSISLYYHTEMRNVFVGVLFAIGFFMFTYNPGYKEVADSRAGKLVWLFAILVALFPTFPPEWPETIIPIRDVVYGWAHQVFAAFLFGTLTYFSVKLFTLSAKERLDPIEDRKKILRNEYYVYGGYIMSACVLLMILYYIYQAGLDGAVDRLANYSPVFWLETIGLWAFGLTWLIKGEGVKQLND